MTKTTVNYQAISHLWIKNSNYFNVSLKWIEDTFEQQFTLKKLKSSLILHVCVKAHEMLLLHTAKTDRARIMFFSR